MRCPPPGPARTGTATAGARAPAATLTTSCPHTDVRVTRAPRDWSSSQASPGFTSSGLADPSAARARVLAPSPGEEAAAGGFCFCHCPPSGGAALVPAHVPTSPSGTNAHSTSSSAHQPIRSPPAGLSPGNRLSILSLLLCFPFENPLQPDYRLPLYQSVFGE